MADRSFRFLMTTWEGGGSVPPVLTVARKLIERGHAVRVMSDSCNRGEVEAVGAAFIAWTRPPRRPDKSRDTDLFRDWEVSTPQEQIERLLERLLTGPSLAHAEDLLDELRRQPADLVVSSEMLFGVMAGCEAARQPFALLTANISQFPIAGIPPAGPGLPPARTAADEAVHEQVAAANRAMLDAGLPALNATRAALGLAPLRHLEDQHLAAQKLLLGTSRAFDFAPEHLPPHVLYVGPQLDDPAWAEPWHSPWAEDDGRPLVLVAFSTSFQDHSGVLQKVIDAAADLPVRLLVTLGHAIAPAELAPADNCVLVPTAPHNQLMREAALVVTHGGHGTVTRALVHGRPMLIVPHGRDQHDNAVRVTERGAGRMIPADAPCSAFEAAIRDVLTTPGYSQRARQLGRRVAEEVQNSPVVEELERLATARAPATEAA